MLRCRSTVVTDEPTSSASAASETALITVVVPAYNAAAFIERTIRSIQGQTETRWQCVVVDDGSQDATLDVLQHCVADDHRVTVVRQSNRGASAARNHGFRAADPQATWVTFMDADDVWRPHALSTLLAAAEKHDGVGAHGLAELIDEGDAPIDAGTYANRGRHRLAPKAGVLAPLPLDAPTSFDVLINGNVLFPPGLVLARRSAYERVGRFDEALCGGEDWDMLIRLSRLGGFAFVDEVILDYRRHGDNMGAKAGVAQQAWLVRCLNFWSSDNDAGHKRRAKAGWRAYQSSLRAQRTEAAREALRGRHLPLAATQAAGAALCTVRFWCGFPLPRATRDPLPW